MHGNGIIQTRYVPIDDTLQFDILSLGRLSEHTLQLRVRVSNVGSQDANITTVFSRVADTTKDDAFSGLEIIDPKHLVGYYPYSDGNDRSCMCSGFPASNFLNAGESFEASIYYPAPPADVTRVDIASFLTPPFIDVPIAAHVAQIGDLSPLDKPVFAISNTLTSLTDSPPSKPSVDHSGDDVDYRLPGDVLFDFNKATLTGKAKALLRDVVQSIDKSKATTVQIDGYTDDSGDAAYNQGLSQRRAAATLAALKALVTRSGISYKTAGHGEDDPVATNGTAAGRQKNRRVTVTLMSS